MYIKSVLIYLIQLLIHLHHEAPTKGGRNAQLPKASTRGEIYILRSLALKIKLQGQVPCNKEDVRGTLTNMKTSALGIFLFQPRSQRLSSAKGNQVCLLLKLLTITSTRLD